MPPEPEQPALPSAEVRELLGKQVDRYQAVITRLSHSGVQVKTWCVTAEAAVIAIAANSDLPELLLVGLVTLVTFCLLDAYYLSLERHFRAASDDLIERVAREEATVVWTELFRIEGPGGTRDWARVIACASSLAISPFYASVAVLLLVGFAVIA